MLKSVPFRAALMACCISAAMTGAAHAGGARTVRDAMNTASVEQQGAGNGAAVVQTGAGNEAVLRQFGSANTGSITQAGDYNRACLLQVGDGLEGAIVQTGNGRTLSVIQTEDDVQRIPYRRCTGEPRGRRRGQAARAGRAW